MPVFNTYHYDRLITDGSIRHVILDPAPDLATPLSCTIVQHQRSVQAASYCAISYVWGKREFPYNLEVRSDGDVSYLRITASVDELLRCFRSKNESCHFWIDALCIDQGNETEKVHQIPLMGRIYEEATDVRIWLGPEDDMTKRLFKFFRKISQIPHLAQSEMPGPKQWAMAGRVARLARRHIRSDGSSGLTYLMDFFNRSWFSRRWVIQEACLAGQAFVHCGRYSIPLSVLVSAATHIQMFDISWYSIKMTVNLRKSTVDLGILELLWSFHESVCLEKKDRVAALFGLLHTDQRFHLDYTVHWTELYKQVANFALSQETHDSKFQFLLHLFEFGPVARPEETSYPSWVPDWSQVRKRMLPWYSHARNPDTYESYPTSPKSFPQPTLTFHKDDLRIHWHPSACGPEGRRVIYAVRFKDNLQDEHQKAKRVLKVLDQLFPSVSDFTSHIFALAVLVETVVKYRHPDFNQTLNNKALDIFVRDVGQRLQTPSNTKTLNALGKLDTLLQNFCLCELEPLDFEINIARTFSFSTGPIQIGDIMIPLWQPDHLIDSSKHFPGRPEEVYQLRTMLAVRLDGAQQPFQCQTAQPNQEAIDQKGRILGPAVCIKSEGGFDDGLGRHLNENGHRYAREQFSISLL